MISLDERAQIINQSVPGYYTRYDVVFNGRILSHFGSMEEAIRYEELFNYELRVIRMKHEVGEYRPKVVDAS